MDTQPPAYHFLPITHQSSRYRALYRSVVKYNIIHYSVLIGFETLLFRQQ